MSAPIRRFPPCRRAMPPRSKSSIGSRVRPDVRDDLDTAGRRPPALAVGAVLGLDQVHKWWMLSLYAIQDRGRVAVLPFLDLVYVKNLGVSYGLLLQEG